MLHDGAFAKQGLQVIHIRLHCGSLQQFYFGIPDPLYQLKPFPLQLIYLTR
ncbi:MAG: hypothetical protein QHH30_07040 [candidate division NC10 bacterium]|nr:hypothetical protein [candidate division NC10 bacterium]